MKHTLRYNLLEDIGSLFGVLLVDHIEDFVHVIPNLARALAKVVELELQG